MPQCSGSCIIMRITIYVTGRKFTFFEGDIVLDSAMRDRLNRQKRNHRRRRVKRAVVRPVTRLWKYGVIPYLVDQGLGEYL